MVKKFLAGGRVLDVGFGFGVAASFLLSLGASIVSIDPDRRALELGLEELRGYGERLSLVEARAEELPFRDLAFDASVSVMAAHHFNDVAKALREMARTARRIALLVDYDGSGPAPHSPDFLRRRAEAALAEGERLGFRAGRGRGLYYLVLEL